MNDQQIEKEIQDQGLTAARVTPDHIESIIVSEQYHVFEVKTTFTHLSAYTDREWVYCSR